VLADPLLVPLGALAFWLFDSLLMLYGNEAVLLASGRAGWRLVAGSGWLFAGRRLALPDPLRPWQPAWRLVHMPPAAGETPRGDESLPAELAAIEALRGALRPLGWLVTALQWALLPGLALEIVLLGTGPALLVVLAVIYALVLAGGALVVAGRARLQLSRAAAWTLAAEGLLCPPFAINVVRKLSLRVPLRGDALGLATKLCDAGSVEALRQRLARDEEPAE
jgi:hypothetical protein